MCECEQPSIFKRKIVRAKRIHKCCECGSNIDLCEEYERVDGLWDGSWDHFKTCLICSEIRDTAQLELDCCVAYGELYETIGSEIEG